jgi:hypothetical protein
MLHLHSTAQPLIQPKSRGGDLERAKALLQRARLMMQQVLSLLLPARAQASDNEGARGHSPPYLRLLFAACVRHYTPLQGAAVLLDL